MAQFLLRMNSQVSLCLYINEVLKAFSDYSFLWMLDLIKGQDPYAKARKDESEIMLKDLKKYFE